MQPAPPPAPRPFTAWELLIRTAQVWLRNAVAFTLVALILDLPLVALELRDAPPQPDPRQAALAFFASWFVWLLTTSALSFGVLWSLSGTRPRALAMLSRAARQLWPVFMAGGAYTALVMLGTFAMVLPGLFLLVVGYLVVPVAVAEPELGLEAALRRSLLLTTGHRLALLGVVLLLGVVGFFGPGALGSLLGKAVTLAKPVDLAVRVAADGILSGLVWACPAVAYHMLRVQSGAAAPAIRG